MATGYSISIGYNGGAENSLSDDEAWKVLQEEAVKIARDAETLCLVATAISAKFLPDTTENREELMAVCESYKLETYEGSPLVLDEENRVVFQMMSGGTKYKRWVRRAFNILLIEAMNNQDIEVSLSVA